MMALAQVAIVLVAPAPSDAGDDAAPHLHADLGVEAAGRWLSPGAATVASYEARSAAAVRVGGGIDPTPDLHVAAMAEDALAMTSALADGMATTTMTRWEIGASYDAAHGPVTIGPVLGVGHRAFSIESTDPARTPDTDYTYLIVGATARRAFGGRWLASGSVSFEPVIAGDQPTAIVVGDQRAWGLAVGAAVEVRPAAHVFARASIDVQRFAWSWSSAGPRGSGGASDVYPSLLAAIGAEL